MRFFLLLSIPFISLAELPDPLIFNDKSKVETLDDWQKRRGEILEILRSECFGRNPVGKPKDLSFEVIAKDDNALKGKAVHKTVKISFPTNGRQFESKTLFFLLIYFPKVT